MRAAVYDRFGPPGVLRVEDVPVPELGEHDVLVRVRAASVGVSDAVARSGRPYFGRVAFGLTRPRYRVLGSDFAGNVEAVGGGVTAFAPGDRVLGATGASFGAHAEYVRVREDGAVVHTPPSLDDVDAVALLDGVLTALPFLRDGARLRAGQSVLVNGASGSVGSVAVQLAKHLGARVTGVCSAAHLDLVTALGADATIDYTVEDFTRRDERYDVVFDVAGKSSFGRCRRVLARDGVYLRTVPSFAVLAQMLWTWLLGRRRAVVAFTGLRKDAAKAADLRRLVELVEAGALTPVVDRRHPLDEAVAAHERVDAGGKQGNVVLVP